MTFKVRIQKDGREEVRTMEADTRFALYDQVRSEGGLVVSIKEARGFDWHDTLEKFNVSFGTGIKREEVIRVAKNIATMLSAGLSLSRALTVIERQSSNKSLKKVASGLTDAIKKGSSFHEALALYPKVFPELFVAMVRAGEESGSLPDALNVIALQMSQAEELSRKVRGAMIYPAIVISGVVIVGVLMLMYVVPTLTSTFKSLGVQVPLATRIIVALSDFLVGHAILVGPALLLLVIGGVAFVRSRVGSRVVLRVSLHLPAIGDIVRETLTARAARTLSSLLSAGVPVLTALMITTNVVHADQYAAVIAAAEAYVKKGEPLSKAFIEHPELYPILMSDMLSVGEETGKVSEMLKQIAEYYEELVSEKTKDLSTIIEPILMLIIGTFVGIFAVAMIAPIYQLSSAV